MHPLRHRSRRLGLRLAGSLSALLLTAAAAAAAPPSRESVEELIRLMRLEANLKDASAEMEQMTSQVTAEMNRQFDRSVEGTLSEDERRLLEERKERLDQRAKALARQELSWEKVRDSYVRLYSDVYSQEEIDGQLAFYRSPVGKAVLAKQELLARRTARLVQEQMARLLPKLLQFGKEVAAEEWTDEIAQKRTVRDVRNVGTALFSWLTDQVGAAAAAEAKVQDLDDYPPISYKKLEKLLVPQYIQKIPENDGWGRPYEYYLNDADPLAPHVIAIRSAGRDGRVSGDSYRVESFEPDSFDEDIVWMDGFFVRWPQKPVKQETR